MMKSPTASAPPSAPTSAPPSAPPSPATQTPDDKSGAASPSSSYGGCGTVSLSGSTDNGEHINVGVRFRPLNTRELESESPEPSVFEWTTESVTPLFPVSRGERSRFGRADKNVTSPSSTTTSQSQAQLQKTEFVFDRVFAPSEPTVTVYEEMAKTLVHSTMSGIHSASFAFGQTSTGKTFTMQGTDSSPGIIPLAVEDVFQHVYNTPDREFLLRVSYVEVYNESINDLLNPSSANLRVFEDRKRGAYIKGLEEKVVVTPEQIFALIAAGEAQRHIGSTNFNAQSSRSHTIFRLVVESKEYQESPAPPNTPGTAPRGGGGVQVATLNLVDLAGSESSHGSRTQQRQKEGSYINRSLLTLTHVIYKLSEVAQLQSRSKPGATQPILHIPYRDSKLTRILQPALQGNSRISIVCTATPWGGVKEETLNTLRFAQRAKKVRRSARVNEVVDERALLLQYKQEIDDLRRQLVEARSIGSPTRGVQRSTSGGYNGSFNGPNGSIGSKETAETTPKKGGGQKEIGSKKDSFAGIRSEGDERRTEMVKSGSGCSGPLLAEQLGQQIDQAIRNLNRVILNSTLTSSERKDPKKMMSTRQKRLSALSESSTVSARNAARALAAARSKSEDSAAIEGEIAAVSPSSKASNDAKPQVEQVPFFRRLRVPTPSAAGGNVDELAKDVDRKGRGTEEDNTDVSSTSSSSSSFTGVNGVVAKGLTETGLSVDTGSTNTDVLKPFPTFGVFADADQNNRRDAALGVDVLSQPLPLPSANQHDDSELAHINESISADDTRQTDSTRDSPILISGRTSPTGTSTATVTLELQSIRNHLQELLHGVNKGVSPAKASLHRHSGTHIDAELAAAAVIAARAGVRVFENNSAAGTEAGARSRGMSEVSDKTPDIDIETLSYIKDLEEQVRSLEHEVARNKLEHNVSKADRSFLEDLLNEKDRTIGEWTSVIKDIEERQAALEAENVTLRLRLGMAVDEEAS